MMGRSNEEVIHRWAQDNGSESPIRTENVWYERRFDNSHVLYSYRTPIAAFVDSPQGRCLLYSNEQHSMTTSHHQGLVHSAVFGRRKFKVFDVDARTEDQHRKNANLLIEGFRSRLDTLRRVRTLRPVQLYQGDLENASRYAVEFGLTEEADVLDELIVPPDVAERAARLDINAATPRVKKPRDRRKDQEVIDSWLAGSRNSIPFGLQLDAFGSVYLREKDGNVQTSMGVSVPMESARRLFSLAYRCQERVQGFQPNHSISVGHYTLRYITDEGNAQVGCHFISWANMAKLAEKLGVVPDPVEEAL